MDDVLQQALRIQRSSKREDFDIEALPAYLTEIKEESKNDKDHFKTISEVEEYVYQVMQRNRANRDRKDASLEDLMAVTETMHSQDLTNKIRQLIYLDNQRRREDGDMSSDGMPSIIQESNNFANMFINMKDLEESDQAIDPKKIKKIEFSQSFKKEKTQKGLPFTLDKIDKLVF